MSKCFLFCWVLLLALLLVPSPALATDAAAGPARGNDSPMAVGTAVSRTAVQPVGRAPATVREDPDAVFRAFEVFAEHERTERMLGALGGVLVGGATMGMGALVAERTDTASAPWLIVGGITAGLSLLSLAVLRPGERVASEMRTSERGHSLEEARTLEAKWRELAERAETERIIEGVVGLVLGAGALGSGIAVLAGAGDLDRDEEGVIGGLLIGSGVGFVAGGTASFFLRKPAERSYAQYQAGTTANSSLELSLGTTPSGVLLGASGMF